MSKTLERYLESRARAQEDAEKVTEQCPKCGLIGPHDNTYGETDCRDRQIAALKELLQRCGNRLWLLSTVEDDYQLAQKALDAALTTSYPAA